MASIIVMLFNILVLQAISTAAPNEKKLVNSYNIQEGPEIDNAPGVAVFSKNNENENTDNKRQKRFYDNINIGYPPLGGYPTSFPFTGQSHYSKRDDGQHTAVHGAEDGLTHIIKRLQDSISGFRQYSQTWAPPTNIPLFIPLLYLPQGECRCNSNTEVPVTPVNNTPLPTDNTSSPDFPTRFTDLDDSRRNWGLESNSNVEVDERIPISLDPITTQPVEVPVPPVEHGTVQEGSQPKPISTTTLRTAARIPSTQRGAPSITPSVCDKAVISCCLRNKVTPLCFEQEGCPDTSIYGRPCNPEVISNLLKKTHHYYQETSKNT